jgi:hypothetical protein
MEHTEVATVFFPARDLYLINEAINAVRNSLNRDGVQERSPEDQNALVRLHGKLGHVARKIELTRDESNVLIAVLLQFSEFRRRGQNFEKQDEVDLLYSRLLKELPTGRTEET